jgi:hypothetical protein
MQEGTEAFREGVSGQPIPRGQPLTHFIRREIEAFEHLGIIAQRITLRGWDATQDFRTDTSMLWYRRCVPAWQPTTSKCGPEANRPVQMS